MFSDTERRSATSRSGGRSRPRMTSNTSAAGSIHDRSTNAVMPSTEPAIWAARHVEWHLDALSLTNYQKLLKQSKEAGAALGIEERSGNNSTQKDSSGAATNTPSNEGGDGDDKAAGESSYFSGFMSRVLNPTSANDIMTKDEDNPIAVTSSAGSRPLRPPRNGCVATANSWMVAAVECPGVAGDAPPLRLVSRWNVRRLSGIDQWMALPPPVSGGDGRIQHVFVDPTGTHTLISARNGEAYYHHSSLRTVQKLDGFGRNADGSWSKDLNGISTTSIARMSSTLSSPSNSTPQMGLSAGSFVTTVAWDREKGTEGTSRKILLGTSAGEIYEYMLASSSTSASTSSTSAPASSTTPKKSTSEADENLTQPVLLHNLQSEAPVTGLIFERLRTGLLVLCATSGKNKRTRFYTFYSAHSSSFRMVLADEAHSSLVELPGSLDHADLRICNENLVMRTETGIYYGTIDRAQSGPAFAGGSMIVDSGILPYVEKQGIPVSLALTPHHIITLSENNEVRFINRVSQKVIQKERVEFVGGPVTMDRVSMLHMEESFMGIGELMSDIRRPDQVWLRKGRNLVHISSTQEDRDVWKYTLFKSLEMPSSPQHPPLSPTAGTSEEEKIQEGLFEQSKSLCTNPSQKAVVTAVRAEYHLSQGRASLAAKYMAQCPPTLAPFADTAVRLALTNLGIDDPHTYGGSVLARDALKSNAPLIIYLSEKMRVGKNNNDKMTCTMIGAWLTELYLHDRESSPSVKQSLSQFLSQNVHIMDAKTIMKILTSHDVNAKDSAAYAAVSGDISTAVSAALRVAPNTQEGVVEALRILNEAPFELAESLYYKYASTLLARAPVLAGKSFLSRYSHGLSPTRLLPSFMFYERMRKDRVHAKQVARAAEGKNPFAVEGVEESKTLESVDVAGSKDMFGGGVEVQILGQAGSFVDDPSVSVKYLEGVIKLGCRSSAIYSFLISLYVEMPNEDPLFSFLSAHVPSSVASEASKRAGLSTFAEVDALSGPLDMSYALRTILGTGRHFRSAIRLYMGFGMRQQAVELALKVDPSLSRELAQDSIELEERKRLWLMIAKNAASEGVHGGDLDVVSKVVSVLKDCGPDVLSIEDVLPFLPDFAQIDQIKDEICEALTSYSSKIEGFLKEMNECDYKCDALRGEISRLRTHRMEMKSDARCAFTHKPVLSAGEPFYVFPSGFVVLESALKKEVMPYLNERQRDRVREIEAELQRKPYGLPKSDADKLQSELDGLIGAECPLTGSVMVASIDAPFEGSDEIGEETNIMANV